MCTRLFYEPSKAMRFSMRVFLVICSFLGLMRPVLCAQEVTDSTQHDLIDLAMVVFKKEPPREQLEASRKVRFSMFPASGGAQQRLTISAINLAFYLGNPEGTNISTVYFYPYTNFSGRYAVHITSNLWAKQNLYNSVGDLRFSSIEYDDYGLGSSTTIDSVAFLDYNNSKLHLQLSRLIYRYLYAGLGYNFDFYYDQSETGRPNQDSDYDRYPYGTENSTVSSGLTFNILRDSRKNSINADGGFYSNLSYRVFNPALGSTYSWTAAFIDLRKYVALPTARRNIAAVRFLYWDTWGDVPYFDLPATFTDREFRMGRGYAYGRFRGNGLLYGELEYRFDLSRTGFWGGVVFANLQSYKEPESNTFVYANPAAGFGLRVKFNKRSNTNLTFDVAFGQNSWGWYLNLGEFF